jgi:hypothetical protein
MSTSSDRPISREQLAGAWRLVAFEGRTSTGEAVSLYGPEPVGQLMYDVQGNMAVVFMRPDRPEFAGGDPRRGTPEETMAAYRGFTAYCGTYTLDPARGTVTHHLLAAHFPNWVGTDQLRYASLAADTLNLETPLIHYGDTEWSFKLVWRRNGR